MLICIINKNILSYGLQYSYLHKVLASSFGDDLMSASSFDLAGIGLAED